MTAMLTSSDLASTLQNLETRAAMAVANVHGSLTRTEVEKLWILRRRLGLHYDAINRRWLDLQD